jgi:hypothetical protein
VFAKQVQAANGVLFWHCYPEDHVHARVYMAFKSETSIGPKKKKRAHVLTCVNHAAHLTDLEGECGIFEWLLHLPGAPLTKIATYHQ